jgi:hypothetical protein
MSDEYHDVDGNYITLAKLCQTEPEWAANQITDLKEKLKDEQLIHKEGREAIRRVQATLETEMVLGKINFASAIKAQSKITTWITRVDDWYRRLDKEAWGPTNHGSMQCMLCAAANETLSEVLGEIRKVREVIKDEK